MRQSFDLVDVILTRKQCLRIQYYANNHDVFLFFNKHIDAQHEWC